MKPRIKDIAEIADVSVGTVDRVIHNRGEVSAATRKKIIKIIKELNYEPDILASTLASRKSVEVAMVLPRGDQTGSFWDAPRAGANRALNEINPFGWSIKEYTFSFFNRQSFRSALNKVAQDLPDALVMAPVFPGEAGFLLDACLEKHVPVILINSWMDHPAIRSFIGQDSYQSGRLAGHLMDVFLEPGDRLLVINVIRDKEVTPHFSKRQQGFTDYFSGLDYRIDRLNTSGIEEEQVRESLKRMHSETGPYQGIFVTNSRVHRVAGNLDVCSGDKPRLIGYDLIEENRAYLEKGTIDFLISQKPEVQGYKAIQVLFSNLVLRYGIDKEYYLPIDIITRENIMYYKE